MNRQSFFKVSALSATLLFITMYSYFWYSAGVSNIGWAFEFTASGIVFGLVFALIAFNASTNPYLERKHSLIYSGIFSLPVLAWVIGYFMADGAIVDYANGFAYAFLVFSSICLIVCLPSIFPNSNQSTIILKIIMINNT